MRQGGLVVTDHAEVHWREAVGPELCEQSGAVGAADLSRRERSRRSVQLVAGGNDGDPGVWMDKDGLDPEAGEYPDVGQPEQRSGNGDLGARRDVVTGMSHVRIPTTTDPPHSVRMRWVMHTKSAAGGIGAPVMMRAASP
jgi:hypothetical protein